MSTALVGCGEYVVHCRAMNRMRVTKSKRNSRRSHHGVTSVAHTTDEDGIVRMRHRASRLTGMYRGREVLNTTREEEKAEKKAQRRQEGAGAEEEKKTVEQVAAPK